MESNFGDEKSVRIDQICTAHTRQMLFRCYEKHVNARKAVLIDTGVKVQQLEVHVENMALIDEENSQFRSAAREILISPLISPWSN